MLYDISNECTAKGGNNDHGTIRVIHGDCVGDRGIGYLYGFDLSVETRDVSQSRFSPPKKVPQKGEKIMETVYVKEVNKELWIDLGRNHPTKLSALEEAARVIQREVIREKSRIDRDAYIEGHNDGLPECPETDGQ